MAPIYFVIIAFPSMLGGLTISAMHIYMHLLNYTEPIYQRYTVRIIFMVPVYALMSFSSLVSIQRSIYFNSIREVYEAWVIYNFLSLCLAWVGGPGAVVSSLNGRMLKPSWCLMTCCVSPIPLDGRFIRRCKQCVLQFVILKPVLVAITFLLYAKGKYEDGNFSAKQSYLYLTILYTFSYSLALYALALFYIACRDLLHPFNPVPKFVTIKSVIFLTYWQGVLVFLAAKSGFISNAKTAADFQNFIICLEMLAASLCFLYAFPYKEYASARIVKSCGFRENLAHALKFNDFYHDTVHQFAPTYHDYILSSSMEGDEGIRRYRSRTFVLIGQEMDAVRKNRNATGSQLSEMKFSNDSSECSTPKRLGISIEDQQDAINFAFLSNASHSQTRSCDLSLIDLDVSAYPVSVSPCQSLQ